ncbi:unnamed protein product [Gordionus sp. m RMFG-2023]|uniref:uncharacterized protein LOC135932081 n=1 Tax=Gordionus sp. m RMFG-2023 TaxID=3053472 RepID=UPI0030E3120D
MSKAKEILEECLPIISKSIKNIVLFSPNSEFRKSCYELLKVDNITWFESNIKEILQKTTESLYRVQLEFPNNNLISLSNASQREDDFNYLSKFAKEDKIRLSSKNINIEVETNDVACDISDAQRENIHENHATMNHTHDSEIQDWERAIIMNSLNSNCSYSNI